MKIQDSAPLSGRAAAPPPVHDHEHDHEHDHDHGHDHGHDHEHSFGWLDGLRIGVAGVCALGAWFSEAFFFADATIWIAITDFARQFDPWPAFVLVDFLPSVLTEALPAGVLAWIEYWLSLPFSTYGAVGLIFGGWPIFKEAFHNALERRMTMELSMAIAILAATYTGYFFVALMITFFVLIAEVLEGMTVERGRRAIRDLLELLPREVTVRRRGQIEDVKAEELAIGETVLVAPGSRIPVDGAVLGGHSFVDESKITGESMPVEKTAGGRVFAGTINQSGVLEVRAERIGAETSYGQIIEAVERAERSRAPVARLADQLASYIVVFAMGFAILTHYLYDDISTTIAVLVVAGACGVAAGTPLAILGAIGRAARLGAIVKGGVHMEMLTRVNTVVLDKTGTLTFGKPRVKSVVAAKGFREDQVLSAAASAELRSEHPLGKAIVEHARGAGQSMIEPETFEYLPGRGISAAVEGGRVLAGNELWMRENRIDLGGLEASASSATSNIFVARDGRLLGLIAVADAVRPEARGAVDAMHKKGIRVLLLTGDNATVAQAVARDLGIDEVEANMLPEAKVQRIRQLVAEGRIVAMVGDGVNDAPALAAAHVGVAMGSGTAVARESADVVLIGNDLARFVETLAVSRRARVIIWENFVGTIVVDIGGVALAMMGLIGPVAATQIHTGSELLFILNSARLLPRFLGREKKGPIHPSGDRVAATPSLQAGNIGR